jgi:tripartite-type tricarboxylate transporter receptor subunit TctC
MSDNRILVSRRNVIKGTSIAVVGGLAGCTGDGGSGNGGGGDDYPSQEIRAVCPWSAGGGTDLTMRKLTEIANQQGDASFFVENVTGAGGANGFRTVSNAYPNGYTTGVVSPNISTFPHVSAGGDIGPDDVKGVMQYNFDASAITVHKDAPYDSIGGLISWVQEGNTLGIANAGPGSTWHLAAAGFADTADIKESVNHVAYDGAAPGLQAVAGGEIECSSASAAEALGLSTQEGGDLKILASMSDEPLDFLEDVPTLKEEGIDWAWGAWRGFVVPPETPDEQVQRLHDILKAAWDTDEYQSWMRQNGFGLVHRTSSEFDEYMLSQSDAIEPVASELDI